VYLQSFVTLGNVVSERFDKKHYPCMLHIVVHSMINSNYVDAAFPIAFLRYPLLLFDVKHIH
jgi:hypothetical protein